MADFILDKPTFVTGAARQTTPGSKMGLATLNHFGVSVRDVERSMTFYRALTGEEPVGRGKWSSVGLGQAAGMKGRATITWAVFRLNNINIDLLQVDEPNTPQAEYALGDKGAMHVCFEVDDLEPIYNRMKEAGMKFYGPFHRVSQAEDGAEQGIDTVVAYFEGPDGEKLELIAPTGPFVRKERLARK